MFHDKGNDFFFNSTAIQAAAGNVDSPSIDLKAANRKLFAGRTMQVHAMVNTTLVGSGATVKLQLIDSSDDTTFATVKGPGSTTAVVETAAIPIADLVSGFEWQLPINPNQVLRQYLSLRVVIATATITAGTITAGLIENRQTNHI